MREASAEHLQKVIWRIEAKLGDGYGLRLSFPSKNAIMTKRGIRIGEAELWASSLFVERARQELSEGEFTRLCQRLDFTSRHRIKNLIRL